MAQRQPNKWALEKMAKGACNADDVSLMAQCITLASHSNSDTLLQETLKYSLRRAVKGVAPKALSYVLEQGADIRQVLGETTFPWGETDDHMYPSREILKTLLNHGWDINSRGKSYTDKPLLWLVIRNHDLVEWCLAHGASVQVCSDDHPSNAAGRGRPILEIAAAGSNIATFELLRSKGAPLTERVLPMAVLSAAQYARPSSTRNVGVENVYHGHVEMVRHLIQNVGLDVNAQSWWPGNPCSTPLCCITCWKRGGVADDLIWLLLDHGGDPDLAGPSTEDWSIPSAHEAAKKNKDLRFLEVVKEWQAVQDEKVTSEA